jgi:polyribonucleotide nucleotidyltransferase
MKKTAERSMMIGDNQLTLSVGKFAPKADVTIFGKLGDTVVLTTVVSGGKSDLGYFPLSVEYVEKLYAGGKIKGSRWVKREGRPTDDAVLKGRVIDRSIRPLFPKAYKNEVQVVCTPLSIDGENSPDMLAAITASAALHLSGIPWNGPISTIRMGYVTEHKDAEHTPQGIVINPEEDVQDISKLDLVVSSTRKKVMMIETQAEELPEEIIQEAIKKAVEVNNGIIDLIEELRAEVGLPKQEVPTDEATQGIKDVLKSDYAAQLKELAQKQADDDDDYRDVTRKLVDEIVAAHEDFDKKAVGGAIEEYILDMVRDAMFTENRRMDGRALDEIRELTIESGILPRTHGSALFQRGLTQVMSIATLGSTSLEQLIETPEGEESKRYIHHYFSPPYSYGEPGRFFGPGRREIGHGALAEKALEPVLPSREEFPYAIRVVSEVLSSNGSTSMASTCGSTLALMDAGVPIKAPVAGISVGLMYKSDDDYKLMTDIAGIEDFAGHMDFKVAGTAKGVTAIQLDVKNDGLTDKMIAETFVLAKNARTFLLERMNAVISQPRAEVSKFAPKVVLLTPPEDKIGEIIGPGGKNIKRIIAMTNTQIDINDDGQVSISGVDREAVLRAVEAVKSIYREVHVGEEFEGEIKRILPIGAMVEYLPGKEGLVHVSKLSSGFVRDPHDVVSIGQVVKVKVLQIDDRGRINLGMN